MKDGRSTRAPRMMLIGCALAALALAVEPAAANFLVLRSSGPSAASYRPGRALPDNARVQLRQGDVVVVLRGDSTRTLRGPGTFALAGSGGGGVPPAAMRRGRFSALRTAGIVPRSPTIWHVDVSQSGKICLSDSNNVMLWRPDDTGEVTLTVTGPDGAAQTARWPAGQPTLAWPRQLPIAAGAEYRVGWTGNDDPARVTFVSLLAVPTDLTSVAEALIAQGCQNQLDALIETVPDDATAAAE